MEEGLLEKTGKPLADWIKIVKASGLQKHGEIVKFLKSDHGFTHGFANFVSLKAREADAGSHDADDLISLQYSKGKEGLKPIYDRILAEVQEFGKVEVAPKKANVSLRVNRQFALIQPSTKTRIDLGLKFNDRPTGKRLLDSGPFGTMCTHRVQLTSIDDVDAELIAWLREAWKEAGGE